MKISKKLLFLVLFLNFFVLKTFSATLILSGNKILYKSCPTKAEIILDTKSSQISAVDLLIKYNPEKIKILGYRPIKETFQINWGAKLEKNFFRETSSMFDKYFVGKKVIGEIYFIPLKEGESSLSFYVKNFGFDQTLDTNVAWNGKDLLSKVVNYKFLIKKTGNCQQINIPTQEFEFFNPGQTEKKIIQKYSSKLSLLKFDNLKYIFGFLIILLLILLFKKTKHKKSKNVKM